MGKKSNKSTASSVDDKSKKKLIPFKVRSLNDNKSDPGSKLFDKYCESFCQNGKFVEKDYFGLRYTDRTKQRQWLELGKSAYKQLNKSDTFGLSFRVKHYPKDPTSELTQEISKYLFYLQIRRDLTQGRLICTDKKDQARVGGAIFQAELGDSPFANQEELEEKMKKFLEKSSTVNPLEFVKDLNVIYEERQDAKYLMAKQHIDFKGLTKKEAETLLLNHVSKFDTYGIDPFLVDPLDTDKKKKTSPTKDYIGLTERGILTFIETRQNKLYPWDQVSDIMLDGSKFIFTYHPEQATVPRKAGTLNLKKKDKSKEVVKFECFSKESATALWKWTLDRKSFFTLKSANEAKEFHSKRSLFNRGKSFKFSGHSKFELVQTSSEVDLPNPEFIRTASFKRSHFVGTNMPTNLNYRATMPAKTRANISALINDNENFDNNKFKQGDDSKLITEKPAVKRPGVSIALKPEETIKQVDVPPIKTTTFAMNMSALPNVDDLVHVVETGDQETRNMIQPSTASSLNQYSLPTSADVSMTMMNEMKVNGNNSLESIESRDVGAPHTSLPLSPVGLMQNQTTGKSAKVPIKPSSIINKVQPEVVLQNPRISRELSSSGDGTRTANGSTNEKDVINMFNSELDKHQSTTSSSSSVKTQLKNDTVTNHNDRISQQKHKKNNKLNSNRSNSSRNLAILTFFLLLIVIFFLIMESKSYVHGESQIIDFAQAIHDQPVVRDFVEHFYQPAKDSLLRLIKDQQQGA